MKHLPDGEKNHKTGYSQICHQTAGTCTLMFPHTVAGGSGKTKERRFIDGIHRLIPSFYIKEREL